jgi:GntR family transcriptional repressor for pyruvate dehydrogenase complex
MLGTLVRGLKVADPAWHDLVRSALELRRILASEGVALAAERHTEEDLDAIATCVQVLREHVDDPIAFARADLAFMRAVCRAGRNLGLELFLNTFARWPDEHPQLVAILYDDTPASVKLYDPVLDVIRSRNGDAARTAVRRALEALDVAWARRHPPPVPEIAQPANETGQPAISKGRSGSDAGPLASRRGLHAGARKAGKGTSEGGSDR